MSPYRLPRRSTRALLEARAPIEYAQLLALSPVLRRAPQGDGGPVLVLPGLAASDTSTRPLRGYLRDQGHHVHGWRLGRNEGPTPRIIEGIAHRLVEIHDRHERPVALVGWSLGGVFALAFGRHVPGMVRRVVTLGSPLAALDDPDVAAGALRTHLLDITGPRPGPHPPLSSIWSRSDAIVPWRTAVVGNDHDLREDIEVRASHLGIGWNPAALYAVADRLALPDATLPRFEPPRRFRRVYPSGVERAG